ncbi:hypothetical protein LOC68_16955 [Blastopirellula sp. JC732]|uniref:Uncharacterized protein n=1 Tax=Blastopirellula sediminis TaxID=2894196 RepID=A0A9X1MNU6_9BACT|nr:hypothetical protein [Blastopirellula sediminis]MCC9606619.1 hypothetical protein [Blastopirellula sediminis]MCC9630084.1 hypothetical protein [Blastopirellula sediminis]
MQLNLSADQKRIDAYLRERVKDYPVYINSGPGHDEDPITQITFGFAVEQESNLIVVFDTRKSAKCDGEWTRWFREENILSLPNWRKAHSACCDGQKVKFQIPGRAAKTVSTAEDFVETLGAFLRDTLCSAVERGLFKSLPLSDSCLLTVEDFDGAFGWRSDQEDEPKSSEELQFAALQQKAKKLSKKKQIELWIGALDQLAQQPPPEYLYLTVSEYGEQLAELGEASALPALQLALKWAKKYEFTQVGRKREELSHAVVAYEALEKGCEIAPANRNVETLLVKIVQTAAQANADHRFWGPLPMCAARFLNEKFDGYPEPKVRESNNRLLNVEAFTKRA